MASLSPSQGKGDIGGEGGGHPFPLVRGRGEGMLNTVLSVDNTGKGEGTKRGGAPLCLLRREVIGATGQVGALGGLDLDCSSASW